MKKKQPSRTHRGGLWFLVFSFSAAFIYFHFAYRYFYNYYHPAITQTLSKSLPVHQANNSGPQFDFYSMLPKIEVQVKANSTPNMPELSPGQPYYILQIATTTDNAGAEALVTKLGVMGLNAFVKNYPEAKGKTEYRILVGPYVDRKDVDTDRAYLKSNHVDSLLINEIAPKTST